MNSYQKLTLLLIKIKILSFTLIFSSSLYAQASRVLAAPSSYLNIMNAQDVDRFFDRYVEEEGVFHPAPSPYFEYEPESQAQTEEERAGGINEQLIRETLERDLENEAEEISRRLARRQIDLDGDFLFLNSPILDQSVEASRKRNQERASRFSFNFGLNFGGPCAGTFRPFTIQDPVSEALRTSDELFQNLGASVDCRPYIVDGRIQEGDRCCEHLESLPSYGQQMAIDRFVDTVEDHKEPYSKELLLHGVQNFSRTVNEIMNTMLGMSHVGGDKDKIVEGNLTTFNTMRDYYNENEGSISCVGTSLGKFVDEIAEISDRCNAEVFSDFMRDTLLEAGESGDSEVLDLYTDILLNTNQEHVKLVDDFYTGQISSEEFEYAFTEKIMGERGHTYGIDHANLKSSRMMKIQEVIEQDQSLRSPFQEDFLEKFQNNRNVLDVELMKSLTLYEVAIQEGRELSDEEVTTIDNFLSVSNLNPNYAYLLSGTERLQDPVERLKVARNRLFQNPPEGMSESEFENLKQGFKDNANAVNVRLNSPRSRDHDASSVELVASFIDAGLERNAQDYAKSLIDNCEKAEEAIFQACIALEEGVAPDVDQILAHAFADEESFDDMERSQVLNGYMLHSCRQAQDKNDSDVWGDKVSFEEAREQRDRSSLLDRDLADNFFNKNSIEYEGEGSNLETLISDLSEGHDQSSRAEFVDSDEYTESVDIQNNTGVLSDEIDFSEITQQHEASPSQHFSNRYAVSDNLHEKEASSEESAKRQLEVQSRIEELERLEAEAQNSQRESQEDDSLVELRKEIERLKLENERLQVQTELDQEREKLNSLENQANQRSLSENNNQTRRGPSQTFDSQNFSNDPSGASSNQPSASQARNASTSQRSGSAGTASVPSPSSTPTQPSASSGGGGALGPNAQTSSRASTSQGAAVSARHDIHLSSVSQVPSRALDLDRSAQGFNSVLDAASYAQSHESESFVYRGILYEIEGEDYVPVAKVEDGEQRDRQDLDSILTELLEYEDIDEEFIDNDEKEISRLPASLEDLGESQTEESESKRHNSLIELIEGSRGAR